VHCRAFGFPADGGKIRATRSAGGSVTLLFAVRFIFFCGDVQFQGLVLLFYES
jgi:hypothetical protein